MEGGLYITANDSWEYDICFRAIFVYDYGGIIGGTMALDVSYINLDVLLYLLGHVGGGNVMPNPSRLDHSNPAPSCMLALRQRYPEKQQEEGCESLTTRLPLRNLLKPCVRTFLTRFY